MTTKKQKRLASEARKQERDIQHQAQIAERTRIARQRQSRRDARDAEQARKAINLEAAKKLRGGSKSEG